MEKFKLKILNPRSSEIRRRFGDSLNSLFNSQSIPEPKQLTQDLPFKKKSLVNRLKVLTKSESKENSFVASESDLTPVKKLSNYGNNSFVFSSCEKLPSQSWLKPRDPFSIKTSKRFWRSLEMTPNVIVRERREETPDLWSSYNSTPVGKGIELETVNSEEQSQDTSFYSIDSSGLSSSYYSVQSFYSIHGQSSVNHSYCNSISSTPMREIENVYMECDEESQVSKRKMFRAKRK